MYLLNGKKISGQFCDAAGNKYPSNWLALSTPDERAIVGITEALDPVYPYPKLCTWTENDDGTLTVLPRSAVDIAAATKVEVQQQIRAVEMKQTNRLQREALLGGAQALDRLKLLNDEIVALRAKLV